MPDEPKFNQNQYDLLMKCSEKKDMSEWNEYMKSPDHIISLGKANLTKANLKGANLREADLRGAKLWGAKLRRSNLQEADLEEADLWGVDLQQANLQEADLREADLRGANLQQANLWKANLRRANLRKVNLWRAKLQQADLLGADLEEANLREADLTVVYLRTARMIGADLSESDITGAKLYGTSRDAWKINDINCDYVYWDKEDKERTPKNRHFKPGEFEELYKSLPEITYYFNDEFTPLTPLIMEKVINAINQKHPEFEIELDSFRSRGTPHAIFTVLHKEHTGEALKAVTNGYERTIQRLEGKIEGLKEAFSKAIDRPQSIRIEHMGPTFGDIKSGRDINLATDQGTVNVSQDVINLIDKTITESDSSPDDKQDAQQQLENMTQELTKPEPDKGRIKRCYDYVVGVIPKVAEVVPWGKLIEKTLGL